MISARPTCKVDEVDGLISAYNGTRYLVLFGPEKYDPIYNRIRSLKSQESGIIHVFLYKNQNWFLWFIWFIWWQKCFW